MGSKSDLPIMQDAADVLKELGINYEITIVSAHRTPDRMYDYAKNAKSRGIKAIIAGAGGGALERNECRLVGKITSECLLLPAVTLLTVQIQKTPRFRIRRGVSVV